MEIFLQDSLFNAGIRPAIDGRFFCIPCRGAAQIKAMKKLQANLVSTFASYRELEAFNEIW